MVIIGYDKIQTEKLRDLKLKTHMVKMIKKKIKVISQLT